MSEFEKEIRKSQGAPLPPKAKDTLEGYFGQDLNDVKVHTDGAAGSAADALNARAFAVGNNIYFGPGEFSPGTSGGLGLIGHEIAHVIQNRMGDVGGGSPLGKSKFLLGPDRLEQFADLHQNRISALGPGAQLQTSIDRVEVDWVHDDSDQEWLSKVVSLGVALAEQLIDQRHRGMFADLPLASVRAEVSPQRSVEQNARALAARIAEAVLKLAPGEKQSFADPNPGMVILPVLKANVFGGPVTFAFEKEWGGAGVFAFYRPPTMDEWREFEKKHPGRCSVSAGSKLTGAGSPIEWPDDDAPPVDPAEADAWWQKKSRRAQLRWLFKVKKGMFHPFRHKKIADFVYEQWIAMAEAGTAPVDAPRPGYVWKKPQELLDWEKEGENRLHSPCWPPWPNFEGFKVMTPDGGWPTGLEGAVDEGPGKQILTTWLHQEVGPGIWETTHNSYEDDFDLLKAQIEWAMEHGLLSGKYSPDHEKKNPSAWGASHFHVAFNIPDDQVKRWGVGMLLAMLNEQFGVSMMSHPANVQHRYLSPMTGEQITNFAQTFGVRGKSFTFEGSDSSGSRVGEYKFSTVAPRQGLYGSNNKLGFEIRAGNASLDTYRKWVKFITDGLEEIDKHKGAMSDVTLSLGGSSKFTLKEFSEFEHMNMTAYKRYPNEVSDFMDALISDLEDVRDIPTLRKWNNVHKVYGQRWEERWGSPMVSWEKRFPKDHKAIGKIIRQRRLLVSTMNKIAQEYAKQEELKDKVPLVAKVNQAVATFFKELPEIKGNF